jgi:Insertion element 4 transposase N-terminal/Transposase DDE domain
MTMSTGGQVAEHLSIGLLARSYPRKLIRAILEDQGRQSERVRDLPAELVVHYVIALGLFMAVSTGEVLRSLMEGLQWLGGANTRLKAASVAAISKARTRLGAGPLRELWRRTADPIAPAGQPGVYYRQWRTVAIDGSSLDLADTPQNLEHFGRQESSRGQAAFPQLRFVALCESGTHTIFALNMGTHKQSELALAASVVDALKPDMLCLADRLYPGYALWQRAQKTGAALLWRARSNADLPVIETLPDGSYLSWIYPSTAARRQKQGGIQVRVIEYQLLGVVDAEPLYRLITTILSHEQAPANELAALYTERWEIEVTLDEVKTHLRGGQVVLRSRTPELVEQEFYGMMLAHRAVRILMNEAALRHEVEIDRLSFTHSIRVIRRKLAAMPALSPSTHRGVDVGGH